MGSHEKDEHQDKDIDKEEAMHDRKSDSEYGHGRPAQDDVQHPIRQTIKRCKEGRLRRLSGDRRVKEGLVLFEEAHFCATGRGYIHDSRMMELTTVKASSTEEADKSHYDKIYKHDVPQYVFQVFIRHLTKLFTSTRLVTRFVKKIVRKRTVGAKYRQVTGPEIPFTEQIKPPSPLTGRPHEPRKMSEDENKKKKKDEVSSHRHSRFSSRLKCGLSQHSDNYKAYSDKKV